MLETFIETQLFAFLLIFTRVGTAMMIMPGIGDSFTPANVRLFIALGLALVMTPVLSGFLPGVPSEPAIMFLLLGAEAITGLFIGTVMRVLMSALDTAGMVIGLNTGLANAQVFNPSSGGQGSIIGALLSVFGVTMILVTNMHHLLFLTIFESYQMFPADSMLESTGQKAGLWPVSPIPPFTQGLKCRCPLLL